MIRSPLPVSDIDAELLAEASLIEEHGQEPEASDAEVEAELHDELMRALMEESPPLPRRTTIRRRF
jgi:hypothetical protein